MASRSRKPSKAAVKRAADRAAKRSSGEDEIEREPTVLDPPETRPRGRPSSYKPEYAEQARLLCERGATDYDLAEHFEVTVRTIWRWNNQFPDFCQALKIAKGEFDDRIERSLAQRAVGYSYDAVKIFLPKGSTEAVLVPYTEHVPPDVGAAKLWLSNRRRQDWTDPDKSTTAVTVNQINLGDDRSRLELARWIAFTLSGVQPATPVIEDSGESGS